MALKIATKKKPETKTVLKTVKPEKAKPDKDEKPEKKSVIEISKIREKAEAKKKPEVKKPEAKKPEAKKPEAKKPEVKVEVKEVVKRAPGGAVDPAVANVRLAYRSFAQTWLDFALKIYAVSESEAWRAYADTWSDFCATEFPDLPLGTISKFLRVAADWGKALLEYHAKKPEALLPAYEACYTLSVHGDKVPKEDLPKLRKDLIEHKITKEDLLRKLEPYRKPPVTRTHKFDRAEAKRIETEIEKEVEETTVKIEDPKMSAKIEHELASDINDTAGRMLDKVKYMVEHLPLLTSVVEKTTINVVKLAEESEKLQGLIEDYLTKIEKISA